MTDSSFNKKNSPATKRIVNKLRDRIIADVVIPTNPTKIRHLRNTTKTSVRLPHSWRQNKRFQETVEDAEIRRSLESGRVLNWCRTTHTLTPVKTVGDGCCLFYAVSIFLWACTDETALWLRKLVHEAFLDDRGSLRKRWEREHRYFEKYFAESGFHMNSHERDREWKRVLDLSDYKRKDDTARIGPADLPYHCVEEIHIFALVNVLRRPIIVLSETVMRNFEGSSLSPNNCGGVYLPLLWEPKDCFKSPIVIGFTDNHFVPLLSMRDSPESHYKAVTAEHAVPLVTVDLAQLMIHFVTEEEEAVAHQLLTRYLHVMELVRTVSDSVQSIPCAKFSFVDIEEEFDVMKVLFVDMQSVDHPAEVKQKFKKNLPEGGLHEQAGHQFATSAQRPGTNAPDINRTHQRQESAHDRVQLNLSTDPEANEPRPVTSGATVSPAVHRDLSVTDRCQTENCPFYASRSTHPFCHECHKKFEKMKHFPYDKHHSLHKLPIREDLHLPPVVTSLGSYEDHVAEKCHYPGCNRKARIDLQRMCSVHFKATSPNKCKKEGCKFTGTPEQEGYCSKCYADFRNLENLTSLQILDEVPHTPRTNMALTQTFYKCNSDICNAIGYEPLQGYCRDCYIRGVRAGKLKRPMQKIPNMAEPEIEKSLCSTPGCHGLRAKNEVGMCQKCYDENMRNAVRSQNPKPQAEGISKPASPIRKQSPSRKVGVKPEVEVIQLPEESITYATHGDLTKKCIMSGCENPGYEATNHLCQECFNVLCSYHARKADPKGVRVLDAAGAPKEMVRKCARPGCTMYGSVETNGYCSKCFLSVLYKDEEYLPPNVEPLHPVEPILPEYMYNNPELVKKIAREQRVKHLRETRAKPCRNASCDRYGDPIFDGFCSQCYDRHLARTNVVVFNSGTAAAQANTYPVKYSDRGNVLITTSGTNGGVIIEQTGRPDAGTTQYGVQIGNNNYMEINRDIHSAATESTGRCRVPRCTNYGNATCEGFCNTCFPFYRFAN